MENEDEKKLQQLLGFDLDQIFEEESKNAPKFFTPEAIENGDINIAVHEKLVKVMMIEFESKNDIDASNTMLGILGRLRVELQKPDPPEFYSPLNFSLIHRVFDHVVHLFKEKSKEEQKQSNQIFGKYDRIWRDVEFFAEMYFTREVKREIERFDLPKQLLTIQEYLSENKHLNWIEKFLYKALIKIEQEIKQKIENIKRENELRHQLGMNKTTTAKIPYVDLGDIEPRNQLQVYFALRILLCHSNAGKTKQREVMSFLSGYGVDFFNTISSSVKRNKHYSRQKLQAAFNKSWQQIVKLYAPNAVETSYTDEARRIMEEFGFTPPPKTTPKNR